MPWFYIWTERNKWSVSRKSKVAFLTSKMKIMILSLVCWVVADVAAIAIRNFEDKSDAATVPGSFIR